MKIERIRHNNEILAILLKKNKTQEGFEVLTPPEFSLQFGINVKKKGEKSKAHFHPSTEATKEPRQEILHIIGGRIKLTLYTTFGKKVGERILNKGDTVLLTKGHGLEVLEDTRMIEIKQGPFPGPEKDKIFLED